jgi:hypothetical protein
VTRSRPRRRPLLLVALLACACGRETPLFERVATGAEVALLCGEPGVKDTILDVNGNGLALLDADGDGDLDLLLVDGSTRARLVAGRTVRHQLLLNVGVRDGAPRFEPAGADTGLQMQGWPTGVAVGDVDRDGRPDVLVGGLGEDALFLNRTARGGPARFEKHALPGRTSLREWTASVALADYDGDGLLDAYLARYLDVDPADPPMGRVGALPCTWRGLPVMCGPHGLPPQPDVLLRGDGTGDFEDVSETSGIRAVPPAFGLGVLFADLDDDGRPDVYVANDSVPNTLLRNRGDGTFEDRGALSGAVTDLSGRPQAGMGVDLGDFDGDGDFDLAVTNFSDENLALYRHDGGLFYREVSAVAGVAEATRPTLGWGVHLADFDADGLCDLYASNGHVYLQADQPATGTSWRQRQHLFRGLGGGRFGPDVFPESEPWAGRGSVRGDLDGDGDLDLVTLTIDGTPRVYVNRTDDPSRQMLVTLEDPQGTPIGATLKLRLEDGPRVAQVLSSSGFQGAGDQRLHVAGRGPVLTAQVRWSGGALQDLRPQDLPFGRHLVVRRGEGVVSSRPLVERVKDRRP